jgi:hypothetical protein
MKPDLQFTVGQIVVSNNNATEQQKSIESFFPPSRQAAVKYADSVSVAEPHSY